MSDNNIISINSKKPIPKITLVNKQDTLSEGTKEFKDTVDEILEKAKTNPINDFIIITADNKNFSNYVRLSKGIFSGIGMMERAKSKMMDEVMNGD